MLVQGFSVATSLTITSYSGGNASVWMVIGVQIIHGNRGVAYASSQRRKQSGGTYMSRQQSCCALTAYRIRSLLSPEQRYSFPLGQLDSLFRYLGTRRKMSIGQLLTTPKTRHPRSDQVGITTNKFKRPARERNVC